MKQCPECRLVYPNESTFCFVDGAALLTLRDPRIGTTLAGRYVIERELGVGGMATVYAARFVGVDRPCAIKVLSAQFAADPVLRERFVREAKHAQRIAHPNVIEISDHGDTDDGAPFLVMELLLGRSLAAVIAEGALPMDRALPIAIEMMRALARAHDFEVIHRDLKPENVFVLAGDHVKLLDFGIARCAEDARLTNLGEVFGTPQYMAPERGTSIDAAAPADLYAFGVMLHEMLTGHLPFEAKDPASFLIAHIKQTPPRLREALPGAPELLDQLVFDLMAKKAADRPPGARHVLGTLVRVAVALGVAVPPEPEDESAPPSKARSTGDPWSRRLAIFERMLAGVHPGSAPPEAARALDALRVYLGEIARLSASVSGEQHRLEAIEQEAREGRQRLGRAMDSLTIDAARARAGASALRASATAATAAVKAIVAELRAAHREVIAWEGRSAFVEPYRELADGYRRLAELTDAWWAARERQASAESEAAEAERAAGDVSFQIRSLLDSLGTLEQTVDARRRQCQATIAATGGRAHQLEGELLALAASFCAPLRQRPELASLFAELERA